MLCPPSGAFLNMLSLFILFMVYSKRLHSRKTLLYYVVLNRNNCVVKNLFIICLLFLGGWPRHEAL